MCQTDNCQGPLCSEALGFILPSSHVCKVCRCVPCPGPSCEQVGRPSRTLSLKDLEEERSRCPEMGPYLGHRTLMAAAAQGDSLGSF